MPPSRSWPDKWRDCFLQTVTPPFTSASAERTAMHFRKHAVLLIIIAACVATIRISLQAKYAVEYRTIQANASIEKSGQMQELWQSLRYVKLSNTNLDKALIKHIDLQSLDLTAVQRDSPTLRLKEVFQYLQNPNLESYRALKTVATQMAFLPSVVASDLGSSQNSLELVWKRAIGTNGVRRLRSICPESVAIDLSRTNSSISLIKGKKTGKLFGVCTGPLNSGFQNLAQLQNKDPLYFDLSFYGRVGVYNCGPIFLKLEWLPSSGKWGLSQFAADSCLDFAVLF
jgi:hypothetical protein